MATFGNGLPQTDTVFLQNVPFQIAVGLDAWSRKNKPQPVSLSVQISHSVEGAAANDDVSQTLDYGKLYKALQKRLQVYQDGTTETSLDGLLNDVSATICGTTTGPSRTITIELPKACLRCIGGVAYSGLWAPGNPDLIKPTISFQIRKIECACIVGVNPHERLEKQDIFVTLELRVESHEGGNESQALSPKNGYIRSSEMVKVINGGYQIMVRKLSELVGGTAYETIESLASFIARYVVMDFGVESVTVTIEKPSAIAMVEAAGVRITRNRAFFEKNDFWKLQARE